MLGCDSMGIGAPGWKGSRGNCCAKSGWVFGWLGEGLAVGVWGVTPLSCSKAWPGPMLACSPIVKVKVKQAG